MIDIISHRGIKNELKRMKEKPKSSLTGRLRIIQKLKSDGKFSLSVGSKGTRFANTINLDLGSSVNTDIVADAQFLPFRNRCIRHPNFTKNNLCHLGNHTFLSHTDHYS
jgi:hypothetical protein